MPSNVRNIKIEDFDYPLPDERIALHPLSQRDACKLLCAGRDGEITHHVFSELPSLLRPDTLIIANETKVIRARMEFHKETGARIEVFLLEPLRPNDYVLNFASTSGCAWSCLVGNRKKWKEAPLTKKLNIAGHGLTLRIERGGDLPGNAVEVNFSWDNPSVTFAEILEAAGNIPIPPYLNRESEERDTEDYQTVYSRCDGSVAAPTAGLHFTPELLKRLKDEGHDFATVTLHVGAGTFQPVKSKEIGDHPMHTEWISVPKTTIDKIVKALEEGRDILAVGTTSVRTLESLPYLGTRSETRNVEQWDPYQTEAEETNTVEILKSMSLQLEKTGEDVIEATTSIMIAPGYKWRIVNRLITNFHQPKSTLLLLVGSFLGAREEERWREIYDEALRKGYRFLSYGDACLFDNA